jgi:processive 1,2-diacylglycerol beta-glucosyltransferase
VLITESREGSACNYHRIELPLSRITVAPKVPTLFVNRVCSWSGVKLHKHKLDGGRIVVDLDDHFVLPDNHHLAESYRKSGMVERSIALLGLADVVTVTTDYLAEQVRHYVKSGFVAVLPNALPFDEGQFNMSRDRHSGTPIVWAGGSSHEYDLQLMRGTFDSRRLTLGGYQRTAPWFNMVQTFPGCRVKEARPLDSYMELYEGHKFALAPLERNAFTQCKSNLKVLEAGAKGLPIICSRTLPYDNATDRKFIRTASNSAQWAQQVHKLLSEPDRCIDEGQILAAHVRQRYNLDKVNVLRRELLEG